MLATSRQSAATSIVATVTRPARNHTEPRLDSGALQASVFRILPLPFPVGTSGPGPVPCFAGLLAWRIVENSPARYFARHVLLLPQGNHYFVRLWKRWIDTCFSRLSLKAVDPPRRLHGVAGTRSMPDQRVLRCLSLMKTDFWSRIQPTPAPDDPFRADRESTHEPTCWNAEQIARPMNLESMEIHTTSAIHLRDRCFPAESHPGPALKPQSALRMIGKPAAERRAVRKFRNLNSLSECTRSAGIFALDQFLKHALCHSLRQTGATHAG